MPLRRVNFSSYVHNCCTECNNVFFFFKVFDKEKPALYTTQNGRWSSRAVAQVSLLGFWQNLVDDAQRDVALSLSYVHFLIKLIGGPLAHLLKTFFNPKMDISC